MPASTHSLPPSALASFGDLLKFLRRRAGLTQHELSIAVGYSEAQISRLETSQRLPDLATLTARFAPALLIEDQPEVVARLLELAAAARGEPPPEGPAFAHPSEPEAPHQARSPGAPAGRARRHNLPLQLNSFIGREREIAQLKRLLTPLPPLLAEATRRGGEGRSPGVASGLGGEARLVTLTGAGGCGKTRLALEVAGALESEYADGVWLVELASLADPALIPQSAASALGVREQPGCPLTDTLAGYLRPRRLLLVLDNCEHLIEACALLAEALLQACPLLTVLATSREMLEVPGERVFYVPSLSLPPEEPAQPLAAERLAGYEAVRLFIDRAATALPGFALAEGNVPAVVQVCRRLDGIPLALELAASRVSVLRVEQIASRLDDRFSLLTGGSRTALPRHQTLRASIDWSYDLLSKPEQTLLQRLSVFAGGWTLEAAEAVCAGEGLAGILPGKVLELLTQLANKSLAHARRVQGTETRYSLLETIREYALGRLIESGQADAVRRRHANFFLHLAEFPTPDFVAEGVRGFWLARGGAQGERRGAWLARLASEQDNLRAALRWTLEDDPDIGLRLAVASYGAWFFAGLFSEARAWLDRALALGRRAATAEARAGAHFWLAYATWIQGHNAEARTLFETSARACEAAGDQRGRGFSLYMAGRLGAILEGPQAEALSLQEKGVEILRASGDRWMLAQALAYFGGDCAGRGDEARAQTLEEESAALYRELGDPFGLAVPLGYLGYLALRRGDFGGARALFEESLLMMREHGNQWNIAWRLEGFAGLAAKQGQAERAARLFGAAEAALEAIGASFDASDRIDYDRHVRLVREQLDEETLDQVWAEGRRMTLAEAVTYALEHRPAEGETLAGSIGGKRRSRDF